MGDSDQNSGRGKWIGAAAAAVVLVAAVAIALGLLGRRSYSQDSPDALLVSARQMVTDGNARRLPELIWVDDPQMRPVFKRIGRLLGHLEQLGATVREAFPDEIAEVRAKAEEAAASGEGGSVIARMLTGQGMPSGVRSRGGSVEVGVGPGDRFNDALRDLFADPYGWLERSEGRLTLEYVTDDIVGVAWDGRGVLGVQLVEREGKWYISSPTDLPIVRSRIPDDPDTYRILESLVATLDNAVRDLDKEVKAGEIGSLTSLASEAGEKAAPMFIFGVIAYGKFLEEREREAQAAREENGEQRTETPGQSAPAGG